VNSETTSTGTCLPPGLFQLAARIENANTPSTMPPPKSITMNASAVIISDARSAELVNAFKSGRRAALLRCAVEA